jgi:hypothetical protein
MRIDLWGTVRGGRDVITAERAIMLLPSVTPSSFFLLEEASGFVLEHDGYTVP